jgi:hypothetical protein
MGECFADHKDIDSCALCVLRMTAGCKKSGGEIRHTSAEKINSDQG